MTEKTAKILVVDDNEDNRFTLSRRLKREGYVNILTANNGREALDTLNREAVDLMLLDMMMPVMNGIEVLQHLRDDPKLRSIPTIMISAISEIEMIAKCIELGAEDYLPKPFNPTILRARVGACLEKVRLRRLERVYLESHDPLTGLANRQSFVNRLREECARQRRDAPTFAAVLIKLDQYGSIVDSLGHAAADELMLQQSRRVGATSRRVDVIARFGEAEFAILAHDIGDVRFIPAFVERLQAMVADPIRLGSLDLVSTISVGIALALGKDGPNADEMLRDAELAVARARAAGGNRFELADADMHATATHRLRLESDLRRGVERGELVLYYQPIIAMPDGNIAGFEALMRWNHPERGLVMPGDFIPLAEETDLILPLGDYALAEGARQAADWRDRGLIGDGFSIAINVSGRQIASSDLVGRCESLLSQHRLLGNTLKVELTESAIVGDQDHAVAILEGLRSLGVLRAIDDFGTGYSALSHLHRFSFSTLKVDRSFVAQMHLTRRHLEIVRSIIDLAHNLGMDVVAEGIETMADMETLARLRCQYLQGYFFSRPLSAEAAEQLLVTRPVWTIAKA